jgi:hypothetical protein
VGQIEKPQSVSGGNIWQPRSEEDRQTIQAWREEEMRKEKIIERFVLLFSYIALITLTGVVIYNTLKTYEYISADKFFTFNQNLLPQFGSEGSWVNLALIAVSSIFLILAIFITWRDYLLVVKDVSAISVFSLLMIIALAINSLSYSESNAASSWLYISKNLVVTPEDIPLENGEIADRVIATNANGDKVALSLKVKNDKLYIVKQEKVLNE